MLDWEMSARVLCAGAHTICMCCMYAPLEVHKEKNNNNKKSYVQYCTVKAETRTQDSLFSRSVSAQLALWL